MGTSSAAAHVTPERLTARAAVMRELVDDGVAVEAAERWCAAWEAEAARQGIRRSSSFFWDAGRGWIDAQRSFATSSR